MACDREKSCRDDRIMVDTLRPPQDCVHPKAQMLGDVVDERGWASHLGPTCGLVEWRLE